MRIRASSQGVNPKEKHFHPRHLRLSPLGWRGVRPRGRGLSCSALPLSLRAPGPSLPKSLPPCACAPPRHLTPASCGRLVRERGGGRGGEGKHEGKRRDDKSQLPLSNAPFGSIPFKQPTPPHFQTKSTDRTVSPARSAARSRAWWRRLRR